MAVSTAMPEAARELDAVRSYGLAFSVMLTTQLLGIVLAGVWCDRSGPLPSLFAGQLLFAVGCALCGASQALRAVPRRPRGRPASGAGLIIVAGYVVIGRAYPESLRPKVFSVISAAWVLPSLLGPPISAWVTTTWSWRWVFWLVVLPVVVRAGHGLRPPRTDRERQRGHRRLQPRPPRSTRGPPGSGCSSRPRPAPCSGAPTTWSSAGRPRPSWRSSASLGIAATAPLLLPRGTWLMRRGLPSVMLARFLLTCSFFGTITYIPLMLVNERGQSLGTAGTILAVGSLGWSAGSWVQGRDRWAGAATSSSSAEACC